MLISKKQQAANQANAKKSTGPKTPEGKDIARLNAMKHMLYTQETVVYSAGETDEMWRNHWQTLVDDLRPQDSVQFLLVHDIASCTFRLLRIKRMEGGHLDARCNATYNATMSRDTDGRAINKKYDGYPNGQVMADSRLLGDTAAQVTTCTKLLPEIWKQEVRLRNAWKSNLRLLKELQAESVPEEPVRSYEQEPEPAPQPGPASTLPETPAAAAAAAENGAELSANKADHGQSLLSAISPAPKPVASASTPCSCHPVTPLERRG